MTLDDEIDRWEGAREAPRHEISYPNVMKGTNKERVALSSRFWASLVAIVDLPQWR